MERDSKVSEHLSTKSLVHSMSSIRHDIEMQEKWRPPGRSNNRHTSGRILAQCALNWRVPVSFGEVEGTANPPSGSFCAKENSDKSSREGKEQMKLKTSEDGGEE